MRNAEQQTSRYAVRSFICTGCSAEVTKRCPSGTKYCTLPCYRSASRPQRKTGVMAECGCCHKEFYVRNGCVKPINFCSVACHNEHQGRAKSSHTCKTCGRIFKWSPSRAKDHSPTYCSITCRTQCPDWHSRAVIAGNIAQQNKAGPNALESAGALILQSIGVKFLEQQLVCKKFLVDALLPDQKIVVQWDGDYWHGLKPSGNAGRLTPRQLTQIRKDISVNAYLEKAGYRVLRFYEYTVRNHETYVRDAIQVAIQQANVCE